MQSKSPDAIMAGFKRKRVHRNEEDEDSDQDLGLSGKQMSSSGASIKLNKQQEDELIKELR